MTFRQKELTLLIVIVSLIIFLLGYGAGGIAKNITLITGGVLMFSLAIFFISFIGSKKGKN